MTKSVNYIEALVRLVIRRGKKFWEFCSCLAYVMATFMAIGFPGAVCGLLYALYTGGDLLECSATGGMASFLILAIGYGIYSWAKGIYKDYNKSCEECEN